MATVQSIQTLSTNDSLAKTIVDKLNYAHSANQRSGSKITVTTELKRTLRTAVKLGQQIDLSDPSSYSNEVDFTYTYKNTRGNVEVTTSKAYSLEVTNSDGSTSTVNCANLTQLVILICLRRANDMEIQVAKKMEQMTVTNAQMEIATGVALQLSYFKENVSSTQNGDNRMQSTDSTLGQKASYYNPDTKEKEEKTYHDWSSGTLGITIPTSLNYDDAQNYLTQVNNKLDDMNSLSQSQLIELQTYTDKRNQAYELASNINKLFGSGYSSIAGNMRN